MNEQDYSDEIFEWNIEKSQLNIIKHDGVSFERAKNAILDEYALVNEYEIEGEQRFASVGMNGFGEIYVVGWLFRGEKIRIITAWKADKNKRRQYEQRRYF